MRGLMLALLLAGCATAAPARAPVEVPKVVEGPKPLVVPPKPLRYQTEQKKCKPVCQSWQGHMLCDDVCR
jgi:hypothetical protein